MKRNLFSSLIAAAFCAAGLIASRAEVLSESATAYAAPDINSIVLGTAQAGSRIATTPAPTGWQAVELAGPHTVYVAEKDTLTYFVVRPGASYLAAPRSDAPAIGTAGEKDVALFADIAGRYNKFSLERSLIGFVRLPVSAVQPVDPVPVTAAPAATPATNIAEAPAAAAPVTDSNVLRQDIPGSPAPANGAPSSVGEPQLPRIFFGSFASSKSPFHPLRPYEFQLNDTRGKRFAFLDVSHLLLTEKLDVFFGRDVTILGTAETAPRSGELIIHVESLKLR